MEYFSHFLSLLANQVNPSIRTDDTCLTIRHSIRFQELCSITYSLILNSVFIEFEWYQLQLRRMKSGFIGHLCEWMYVNEENKENKEIKVQGALSYVESILREKSAVWWKMLSSTNTTLL